MPSHGFHDARGDNGHVSETYPLSDAILATLIGLVVLYRILRALGKG